MLYNTFMLSRNTFSLHTRKKIIGSISIIFILIIYFAYAFIAIEIKQGPVDFETFMEIGRNLLHGSPIYTENSYYPMPYVGIFALFSLVPFPLSLLFWIFIPVFLALIISGWSPFVLLFAPLFAHFIGGQTAVFGMLGLWGYRSNQKSKWSGIWLSILLFKPQLAIAPLIWAGWIWIREILKNQKIPHQMVVFITSTVFIFLPWVAYNPSWVSEWLTNPRGFRLRAMAGLIPRLLSYLQLKPIIFWIVITIAVLVIGFWMYRKKAVNLDSLVLLSFIVLPLLHDYDLIQLIPLLDQRKKQIAAALSSIPLWITIFFAYRNDHAWITATIIAPILLWLLINDFKLPEKFQNKNKKISNKTLTL